MPNTCIYCGEIKAESEFTLEHVIPQSLGGAYAPDYFKTRNVCKTCNGNLGLFVDASFEKDWFIQNWLQMSAMAFFDPENPRPLPLICMGTSSLSPPHMSDDEVCESWLGPLGEQIYWIRPKDEDLYWYIGGNPRTTKDRASQAYFFFSERTLKKPIISWQAFEVAFRNRKKVKKILCTEVQGANPKDIGFSLPDEMDLERIAFFKALSSVNNGDMHIRLSLNVNFDQRFMSKLGLGIGYCLFGNRAIESDYGRELRKGLWLRAPDGAEEDSAEVAMPDIRGAGVWQNKSLEQLDKFIGEEYAVSLFIAPFKEGVGLMLKMGDRLTGTVMCASHEGLTSSDMENIREGKVILLYKHLQRGVSLSLPEYVAYKLGHWKHPELMEINGGISNNRGYFKNL